MEKTLLSIAGVAEASAVLTGPDATIVSYCEAFASIVASLHPNSSPTSLFLVPDLMSIAQQHTILHQSSDEKLTFVKTILDSLWDVTLTKLFDNSKAGTSLVRIVRSSPSIKKTNTNQENDYYNLRFIETVLDGLDASFSILRMPEMELILVSKGQVDFLERFYGRRVDKSELIGHRFKDVLIDTIAHNPIREINETASKRMPRKIEPAQYTNPDGRPFFAKTVYSPIEEDGVVTHIVISGVDVTDMVLKQRSIEKELRSKYEALGSIFDAMDVAMVVYTYPDLKLTHVNRQACESASILLGREVSEKDLFDPANSGVDLRTLLTIAAPYFELALEAGVANSPLKTGPHNIKVGNQEYWLETTFSPVSSDDVITHIVQTSVDVSTLIRATKEVEFLSSAKDNLLTTCSHELRTPLTVMMANLQLMQLMFDMMPPDKQRGHLDRMVAQCRKMSRLINDMMDFSQLSTSNLVVDTAPLALDELISSTIEAFRSSTTTHNITLSGCEPCRVDGDAIRLEQMLYNLLTNAIKYSDEGTNIAVEVRQQAKNVLIRVSDEGYGIPEDEIPHLFERYYRSPDSCKTSIGMGIGLYVSNEIIKRHGGRISVESKIGVGSTFTVALPTI